MKLNRVVMRQADFINLSLRNVLHVLRDAAIFVAIILILFLLNVRTTVITLTALPLSLAVALLVAVGVGPVDQRHDARRAGRRHRRAGGRRDHRRGERLPPAARERGAARRPSGSRSSR